MILFWGKGWNEDDYTLLQGLYDDLKTNYPIKTSLHAAALKHYVVASVRYTQFAQQGNTTEAQKWYNIMRDAGDKAKINPKQLTKADLQGGMNSFSEWILQVEQAVDVIPLLPTYVMQPRDIPDFILWSYLDYERTSAGLPSPSYRDVYQFYDLKMNNYLRETGDPEGLFDFIVNPTLREKITEYIELDK
jgi:hypothetical protein